MPFFYLKTLVIQKRELQWKINLSGILNVRDD